MMTFCNILDQLELFTGHSLNMDTMKIRLPNGELVSSRAFNRMHIGSYFAMDSANERFSKSAYTAYTRNMAYRPVTYWNVTHNIPPMRGIIP